MATKNEMSECLPEEKAKMLDLIMNRIIEIENLSEKNKLLKYADGYLLTESSNQKGDLICWRSLSSSNENRTSKSKTPTIDTLLAQSRLSSLRATEPQKSLHSSPAQFQPVRNPKTACYNRETNEKMRFLLKKMHQDLGDFLNEEENSSYSNKGIDNSANKIIEKLNTSKEESKTLSKKSTNKNVTQTRPSRSSSAKSKSKNSNREEVCSLGSSINEELDTIERKIKEDELVYLNKNQNRSSRLSSYSENSDQMSFSTIDSSSTSKLKNPLKKLREKQTERKGLKDAEKNNMHRRPRSRRKTNAQSKSRSKSVANSTKKPFQKMRQKQKDRRKSKSARHRSRSRSKSAPSNTKNPLQKIRQKQEDRKKSKNARNRSKSRASFVAKRPFNKLKEKSDQRKHRKELDRQIKTAEADRSQSIEEHASRDSTHSK